MKREYAIRITGEGDTERAIMADVAEQLNLIAKMITGGEMDEAFVSVSMLNYQAPVSTVQ